MARDHAWPGRCAVDKLQDANSLLEGDLLHRSALCSQLTESLARLEAQVGAVLLAPLHCSPHADVI